MNSLGQRYYALLSSDQPSFMEAVREVLSNLPREIAPLRLVFFDQVSSNSQYLQRRQSLEHLLTDHFGHACPAFSYVAQPPVHCRLLLEYQGCRLQVNDVLQYKQYAGEPYVLLQNPDGRFLFTGGMQGDDLGISFDAQATTVFQSLRYLLITERFPVNRIVRQWNYIEGITRFEGINQHYQTLNNARSNFYSAAQWDRGYPAATGIGADRGGIQIEVDAACLSEGTVCPIDNRLQHPAHDYTDRVLKESYCIRTTPKFERAKSLTIDGQSLIYVSGTAAIRGEESLSSLDVVGQLQIIRENIDVLIGTGSLRILRVYLKQAADYPEVKKWMDALHLQIPVSYIRADICREELLIELEGVAFRDD